MNAIKFTAVYIITILIPFWFIERDWFWLLTMIGTIISVFELKSFVDFGKTLSQRFWNESRGNRILGVVALSVFYIYLIGHLIFEI